jgi:hypothetical protein
LIARFSAARAQMLPLLFSVASEPQMQLESTLTCPNCAHRATEAMPTDACQFFYDCKGCGTRLKPKPGDCCVFLRLSTVSAKTSWELLLLKRVLTC